MQPPGHPAAPLSRVFQVRNPSQQSCRGGLAVGADQASQRHRQAQDAQIQGQAAGGRALDPVPGLMPEQVLQHLRSPMKTCRCPAPVA